MSTFKQLVVEFKADTGNAIANIEKLNKQVGNSTAQMNRRFGNLQKQLSGFGRNMSVGITLPFIALSAAATKSAMDAVESENLFEVSMGKMAKSARAWSEQLSKSLGMNAYAVRENVGTFNVMLSSMGMNEKAALKMSEGLTKLSYDMASFYNLRPEEAFEKLQSGISGEVEPLKRLGIIVNETTVKQYALRNGLIKQGEALSETGKVAARYGLIMETTKKAQGDMARTIDSPTNQLRVLQETLKQVSIEAGQTFIPMLKTVVSRAKDAVTWFKNLSDTKKSMAIWGVALLAAIGPVSSALAKLPALIAGVKIACTALASSPAIAALITAGAAVVAIKRGIDKTNDKIDTEFKTSEDNIIDVGEKKNLLDKAKKYNSSKGGKTDLNYHDIASLLAYYKKQHALEVDGVNKSDAIKTLATTLKKLGAPKSSNSLKSTTFTKGGLPDFFKEAGISFSAPKILKDNATKKNSENHIKTHKERAKQIKEQTKAVQVVISEQTKLIDIEKKLALQDSYQKQTELKYQNKQIEAFKKTGHLEINPNKYLKAMREAVAKRKQDLYKKLYDNPAYQARQELLDSKNSAISETKALNLEMSGDSFNAASERAKFQRDKDLADIKKLANIGTPEDMLKDRRELVETQYKSSIKSATDQLLQSVKDEEEAEAERTKTLAENVRDRIQLFKDEARERVDTWNQSIRDRQRSETGFTSIEGLNQRTSEAGLATRYDRMLLPEPADTPATAQDVMDAVKSLDDENSTTNQKLQDIINCLQNMGGAVGYGY